MDLRIAVICSSNMNRSMEAHNFLAKRGFYVQSFGTGDKVKIPGPSIDKPNVYNFGTSYEAIYDDLVKRDEDLYRRNGLLFTLNRNKHVKPSPQRFQESDEKFDLLITCEERIFDQVVEYMENKRPQDYSIVHVINVDVKDNLSDATIGACLITDLCTLLARSEDLDDEIDDLLVNFEHENEKSLLHCVVFN